MECALNKPLCKRKLMENQGPFERKTGCPLAKKPDCPLAPPQCPLIASNDNNCPLTKVLGNKNDGQNCPIASNGCPCDPSPPCMLLYDDDDDGDDVYKKTKQKQNNIKKSQKQKRKSSCPSSYPSYGICPKTLDKNAKRGKLLCSCPNNLNKKGVTLGDSSKTETVSNIGASPNIEKQNISQMLVKKGLTVPDCNLSSRRPLPCSECLGNILRNPGNILGSKLDCPYLKIIDLCDDTCLCDDVPRVDSGPPCPFSPPPCPCCAAPRCPLSRFPDCSLISKQPIKTCKPLPCKCYCPVIPTPCSLDIPPYCKMHNSVKPALNPPKCDCNLKKCPLASDKCNCNEIKEINPPIPNNKCPDKCNCILSEPKVKKVPNLLVPTNVLTSLEDTLNELNKICTCDTPPPPEMVNLIPTNTLPLSIRQQTPNCIASGNHDNCPLECLCEPPRTFHVPSCPKKNPLCLQQPPNAAIKGDMICPFSPRNCPLGRTCPYPVAAKKLARPIEKQVHPEDTKPKITDRFKEITDTFNEEINKIRPINEERKDKDINIDKTKPEIAVKDMKEIPKSETKVINRTKDVKKDFKYTTSQSSNCPLSVMKGNKKVECPFSPAPCPLDPIKPLAIKEPKVCPFAPKPICPLMPKPLCPPTSRCLFKPAAPLPECPYAPSTCPLAPKRLCLPEPSSMSSDPDSKCPCPPPDSNCPCPPQNSGCPCPNPDPSCPCPSVDSRCPCSNPGTSCSGPSLDSNCPCPYPNPGSLGPFPDLGCLCPDSNPLSLYPDQDPKCSCPKPSCTCSESSPLCPLITAPKYTPNVKPDSNCPFPFEKSNNSDSCPCANKDNSVGCECASQSGAICPCSMLAKSCNCSSKPPNVVEKLVHKLKKVSKVKEDCPVKIPSCEKFPEGRCPMEDLGLCDCEYPCSPCLAGPQCGTSKALPQYCTKLNCCMGLPLPPVIPGPRKGKLDDKPPTYYKLIPTKPDKEETKFVVEILDRPPNDFPFGPPTKREHPNWYIIPYGLAFEKCKNVAEKLKKRPPRAHAEAQFEARDFPMDPEMEMVYKNRENQARLEREEAYARVD